MENRPLYSAEIAEIIGTPPRWILRAGGGLLLALVLGFGGLAASISIPKQSTAPVRLRAATPPYYLRQDAAHGPLLVAAGQAVRPGQVLRHAAPGAATDERAPFAGTLFYEAPTSGAAQPGDTLGLLAPLATAYRFSGRLAVGCLPELRAQARALRLEVPFETADASSLVLTGQLTYLDPVVRQGAVTYNGQLDARSSAALARHFAALTTLDGNLLLPQPARPVLQRLLNY
jgi:hypothetical protein